MFLFCCIKIMLYLCSVRKRERHGANLSNIKQTNIMKYVVLTKTVKGDYYEQKDALTITERYYGVKDGNKIIATCEGLDAVKEYFTYQVVDAKDFATVEEFNKWAEVKAKYLKGKKTARAYANIKYLASLLK